MSVCKYCFMNYSTPSNLRRHMVKMHPDYEEDPEMESESDDDIEEEKKTNIDTDYDESEASKDTDDDESEDSKDEEADDDGDDDDDDDDGKDEDDEDSDGDNDDEDDEVDDDNEDNDGDMINNINAWELLLNLGGDQEDVYKRLKFGYNTFMRISSMLKNEPFHRTILRTKNNIKNGEPNNITELEAWELAISKRKRLVWCIAKRIEEKDALDNDFMA